MAPNCSSPDAQSPSSASLGRHAHNAKGQRKALQQHAQLEGDWFATAAAAELQYTTGHTTPTQS
jgi:hypothetical protein